jgi:hypothetical protein
MRFRAFRSALGLRRVAIVFVALAVAGWTVGLIIALIGPTSLALVTLLEATSIVLVVGAVGALLLRPRPLPPRDDRIVAFRAQQSAANTAIRSDLARVAKAATLDTDIVWQPRRAANPFDLVAVLALTSTIDAAELARVGPADYPAVVDLLADARSAQNVLVIGAPQEALIAALAFGAHGPRIVCIDHDAEALDSARAQAGDSGLAVEFIEAPLTGLGAGNWYQGSAFAGLEQIDVVYVGGPPWALGPRVRDRTLAHVVPLLADGARVLVPSGDSLDARSWADRAVEDESAGILAPGAPGFGTFRLVLRGR